MRTKVKAAFLVVGAVSMAACPFVAASAEKRGVPTVLRVLVGKPAAGEAEGASVLIVPGTVVLLGKTPEEAATDVLQLMGKLKDSYRLGEVSVAATIAKTLGPNQKVDVPARLGDLEVGATLLGCDAKQATYGVSIKEGGKVVSEPKITIPLGDRGIVGSRDGDAAPYFFLTIEPLEPYRSYESFGGEGDISEPKLISKVRPIFPEQARKAGIDGVVVLRCTVGADGSVREVKAIRSEPMGLTEAAVDAVKQWRYEPARTAAGKPVEVLMTVTISFLLDRSKPPKDKK
jgi:TonB family protein